jgi:hypothetical protein
VDDRLKKLVIDSEALRIPVVDPDFGKEGQGVAGGESFDWGEMLGTGRCSMNWLVWERWWRGEKCAFCGGRGVLG